MAYLFISKGCQMAVIVENSLLVLAGLSAISFILNCFGGSASHPNGIYWTQFHEFHA